MAKPIVYIAKPIPPEVEAYLSDHCECRKWGSTAPVPQEVLYRELADAEGLLVSGTPIDEDLLAHAPKLKIVSAIAVGYNNFDLKAMRKKGVLGTNTPSVLDETVADLVFALMLASARRIAELDRLVKEGGWAKGDDTRYFGTDVHHATLGIIGLGRIGEAVARRARFGFSMEVLYHNRTRKPSAEQTIGARYAAMDELLGQSDFVLLMTPLSAETERFFGLEQFRRMKRTAFFINASRGQTVREDELIEALQQKLIRGAALDVFEREPVDPASPLLKLENVVTVPHIGSATAKTRFDMAMLAARNLVAGLEGRTPPQLVPELG